MEKKIVFTENAPKPIGPYNQAVLVNGTLYCSGQIAIDISTGEMVQNNIESETVQVMKNMSEVLKAADMDFSNVVKVGIFVTDMGQFSQINQVYATYFDDNFPARETVEVSALPKGANVEISMIAVK